MTDCYIQIYNFHLWVDDMIADIHRMGMRPVLYIVKSDWQPCLDYAKLKTELGYKVMYSSENLGVHTFFMEGNHERQNAPYFLTDNDLDLSGMPDNTADAFLKALERVPTVPKIGASLRLDDIPEGEVRDSVLSWEEKHWKIPVSSGIGYYAEVDTTFALYHPDRTWRGNKPNFSSFYSAVRMAEPYTARHRPWYLDDPMMQTDDYKNYVGSAHPTAFWTKHYREKGLIDE